ncbi:MAG: MFS transporter [Bacteroidota bacterium]
MSTPAPSSPSIFPVLLVNFIGMLGYSIVIPLLVFLVQDFGGNEVIYGLMGAVYPTFQLIGAPLLGRWSDQIGRRRVLMISQAGTFLAWGLFIIALMLPVTGLFTVESSMLGTFLVSVPLLLLFLARALDGLTGGNVSVANAYLSDVSTEKNRKANFGKMGSSTSLGFVIGPVLAGLLGASVLGELLPVMVAAGISLVAIFVIFRFLPESRPELVPANWRELHLSKLFHVEHKECYDMEDCQDTTFRSLIRQPRFILLFGIYFFTFLGFSFYYASFPVYASSSLGWNTSQLGIYFAVYSGIMVVIQGPGLGYLSSRVNSRWLVLIGSVLMGLSFVLLPQPGMVWVWMGVVFLSVGNALMWPSFLAILSEAGTKNNQGTIQGYANSTGSLASILGMVLGGVLFSVLGPSVFYLSATFLVIIAALSFRL